MRQLIINADDLGADEARNAGIFEAIGAGTTTAVSLLANGPALNDALCRIRSLHGHTLSIGIHINLSEGTPLSSNLTRLTGQDGDLLKKAQAHHLLMRQRDPALEREIVQEMTLQIESVLAAGIEVDHLDGHQHVHVFPAVFPAAIKMVLDYKIPWMRIPCEPQPLSGMDAVSGRLKEEAQFFSSLAEQASVRLNGSAVRTPDHFRGLYMKGRLSPPLLLGLLGELKPGLTELMVHPGRTSPDASLSPFSSFSTPDRERELETLLDPGFREALKESGIRLTPFPHKP
jgi:predicted glycoside hydrolase/deacetylase ChbG (UPF0249 family)